MTKFRKKPIVIEAIQWNGNNLEEVKSLGAKRQLSVAYEELIIFTLEGSMLANKGDWVIKGVKGELYPCKPDIFAETYEEVED